jgi:hypothetical protein
MPLMQLAAAQGSTPAPLVPAAGLQQPLLLQDHQLPLLLFCRSRLTPLLHLRWDYEHLLQQQGIDLAGAAAQTCL